MRVLKPKLEAATAQYNKPEDQMQKQQAMMAEYAKYGVSPLSGCLPMLIQRDWGVGIADIEQARTPLFTTGSQERSGMGFTIMESFMDTVKVRSTPGKGTTVTMRRRIARRAGR